MNKTTLERIEALRVEAGEHGDLEMVAVCDRAIEGQGHADALTECLEVLADAEAMSGEEA